MWWRRLHPLAMVTRPARGRDVVEGMRAAVGERNDVVLRQALRLGPTVRATVTVDRFQRLPLAARDGCGLAALPLGSPFSLAELLDLRVGQRIGALIGFIPGGQALLSMIT